MPGYSTLPLVAFAICLTVALFSCSNVIVRLASRHRVDQAP